MWTIKKYTSKIVKATTGTLASDNTKIVTTEPSSYEMFADDKIARDEALYAYGTRFSMLQERLRDLARDDADLRRELADLAQYEKDMQKHRDEIVRKRAAVAKEALSVRMEMNKKA